MKTVKHTWSRDHYKAIDSYAKRNELRMALSSWPIANFIDKDGKTIQVDVKTLMADYWTVKSEEEREKRLKKREDK